jgi:D-sedoheptulose 7-phosphate isomerase
MTIQDRIRSHFEASVLTKQRTLVDSLTRIVAASERLAAVLKAGNKVLACGNGGSAADAQHFAAELTGRFERERPGLPGIALTVDSSALTAIANDYSYERVFSKQVEALARPGDLLLAISTSGNSPNVVKAIEAMHTAGGSIIALTGKDGGRMAAMLRAGDIELRAASTVTARIQEVHILFLHCLCDAIDEMLYPKA